MREVHVCACCLATNVRMHSIILSGLLEPYQLLSGVQELGAGMSDKLCWECAAFVCKFRAFRFKCDTAHRLLRDIYLQNLEVTEEKVKQIDRHLLISSLSISRTKCYSVQYIKAKVSPLPSNGNESVNSKKKTQCEVTEEKKREKVKQETEREPHSPKLENEVLTTEEVMIKPECELDFENYDTEPDRDNREEQAEVIEPKVEQRKNERPKKRRLAPVVNYNVTEEVLSHDQAYEHKISRQSSPAYQKSNFKCDLCYQGFSDGHYFNIHMARHSPKMGSYECEFCKMRFGVRKLLVMHISRTHSSKYTCNLCSNVSYSRAAAKAHFEFHMKGLRMKPCPAPVCLNETRGLSRKVRTKVTAKAKDFDAIEEIQTQEQMMAVVAAREHTDSYRSAPFKCKHCYKGFRERKTYTNHMLIHDPVSGTIECDICKLRVKSRPQIQKHISNNHLRKYTCKTCGNVFYNRTTAQMHYAWHKGVTYACNICGATFSNKSSHFFHIRIKHPSEHVCRICRQSFVSPMGLCFHTKMMHSVNRDEATTLMSPKHELEEASIEAPFEYDSCGETLADTSSLKRVKNETLILEKGDNKRIITCEQCGEQQANGRAYNSHFRLEHPGKTRTRYYRTKRRPACAMCEYCGQVFAFKSLLRLHINKHTGERPHKCATCGKKFFTNEELKAHSRTHTKELPYKCDVCGSGFSCSGNMRRHKITHSDAKPYPCDTCGKKFKHRATVKSHVQFVHMKQPWPKRGRSKRSAPLVDLTSKE